MRSAPESSASNILPSGSSERILARSRGIKLDQLDAIEECPSIEAVEAVSKAIGGGTPAQMLAFLSDFARRCFVCGRLLPWKAEAARVFKFFADCVEAEDHHLELVAELAGLVGD